MFLNIAKKKKGTEVNDDMSYMPNIPNFSVPPLSNRVNSSHCKLDEFRHITAVTIIRSLSFPFIAAQIFQS